METTTRTPTRHPVLACADAIDTALTDVAEVSPIFMTATEKAQAMRELTHLTGRVEALRMRVLAAADDVAIDAACRTVADWLAPTTRTDRAAAARVERLAVAVDHRYQLVGAGLGDGRVSVAQAEVIVHALDQLPDDLDPELRHRAEKQLVADAEHFAPKELRRLGARVLDMLAPEIAEEHERQPLERELQKAEAATALTFRRRGDGATDINARVPDHVAGRLRTYLNAYTAPRQHGVHGSPARDGGWTDPATGIRLSPERLRGEAFCALLEHLDPASLPEHGGTATTVVITMDYDKLREQTDAATTGWTTGAGAAAGGTTTGGGVAETADGTPMPPGEVRRLACTAGIIPAVLGSTSEVLDLGRTSRLFSPAQRRAMAIGHPHCRAEGCSMPAAWCEAHHAGVPWSEGGKTDLADGLLLCSWHHHRAHACIELSRDDPRYQTHRLPNGDLRYHRRT